MRSIPRLLLCKFKVDMQSRKMEMKSRVTIARKSSRIKWSSQWHFDFSALYVKSIESAQVSIMSLKNSDLQVFKTLLQEICQETRLEIKEKLLVKSQLRGITTIDPTDMLILLHRAEGRLLLTDRNGFYNDLLASAFRALEGRVLIIITNVENDPPDNTLSSSEISELAKYGDQPTIGVLSEMGKVICYKSKPSAFQANHIQLLLKKSAFYREIPSYAGLPDSFHPASKSYKCPLL